MNTTPAAPEIKESFDHFMNMLITFLLRFERENQYRSHVCALHMKLEAAAS